MRHIRSVKALPNHHLYLKFDDGLEGELDFAPEIWGPVFEPLKKQEEFEQLFLNQFGVLTWPCGADYDTQSLYRLLQASRGLAAHQ